MAPVKSDEFLSDLAAFVNDAVTLFDVRPGEHAHIDGPALVRMKERGDLLVRRYATFSQMEPERFSSLPTPDSVFQRRVPDGAPAPPSAMSWRRVREGVPLPKMLFDLIMSLQDMDKELSAAKTEIRRLTKENSR